MSYGVQSEVGQSMAVQKQSAGIGRIRCVRRLIPIRAVLLLRPSWTHIARIDARSHVPVCNAGGHARKSVFFHPQYNRHEKKTAMLQTQTMAATGAVFRGPNAWRNACLSFVCACSYYCKRHAASRQTQAPCGLKEKQRLFSNPGNWPASVSAKEAIHRLPSCKNGSATRGWRMERHFKDSMLQRGEINHRSRYCCRLSWQPGSLPCALHRATLLKRHG